MIGIGTPRAAEIAGVLATATGAGPPWAPPAHGAARCSSVGRVERTIGRGERDFRAAADGLRRWKAHAAIGARIHPPDAPLEPGVTVVVIVPVGPVVVTGACRIVRTTDEPRRFGFVYATLPGHPLRGAEEFVVDWREDDTVCFMVEAVSEPGALLARVGLPVVRQLQRHARSAFADGMAAHVNT